MTFKQVLQKCTYVEALEPLLHKAPPGVLKYVLGQFSKVNKSIEIHNIYIKLLFFGKKLENIKFKNKKKSEYS